MNPTLPKGMVLNQTSTQPKLPSGMVLNQTKTPTPVQQSQDQSSQIGVGGLIGAAKNIASNISSSFKSGVGQVEKGGEEIAQGGAGNIAKGVISGAAGALNTATSPITGALKSASSQLGVSDALNAVKKYVVDPTSNAISDAPALQRFMTSHPDAEEVANNLITIGSAFAGGKTAPEVGSTIAEGVDNAGAAALKPIESVASSAKSGLQNKVVNSTVEDWNRVGGDYVKTDKLLQADEARLSGNNNPTSLQDTPTFLAQHGLTPNSLIKNGKFETNEAADALTTKAVKPLEDTLTNQLKVVQQGQPPVPLKEVRDAVTSRIENMKGILEEDRQSMLNSANNSITALEKKYPDGIPLDKLNEQKGLYWKSTKFDITKPLQPQVNYNIGTAMKDIIENKAGDANVKELNGVLANYYKAGKFLRGLDNRVPKLTVGQKITRGVVKGVATGVGEKLFGLSGGVGGFLVGKSISHVLENASNPLKGIILRNLEKTNPEAYTNAIKWLGQKEAQRLGRLTLPTARELGSPNNPHIMKSSVKDEGQAKSINREPIKQLLQLPAGKNGSVSGVTKKLPSKLGNNITTF